MTATPTYQQLSSDMQASHGRLKQDQYTSHDERARELHRLAVLRLACHIPDGIAEALDFLANLNITGFYICTGRVPRRSHEPALVNDLAKLVGQLAQYVEEADDSMLANITDASKAKEKATRTIEAIGRGYCHAAPLCPSPTKGTLRAMRRGSDRDVALLASDIDDVRNVSHM